MKKPSVNDGRWITRAAGVTDEGDDRYIEIRRQAIDGAFVDHYAIYIEEKRQRKTYFGESAHYDVARAYNDMVHWTCTIDGSSL